MSEELTSAKIFAAQYAGGGDAMFYHNAVPGWMAAMVVVAILLLVAIVVIILDSITEDQSKTMNYKEVNYDNRGMGEERSRYRDGQGAKGSR